jgi:hypothetical protein
MGYLTTLSIPYGMAPNSKIISETMNCNRGGRSRSWSNLRQAYCTIICLYGMEYGSLHAYPIFSAHKTFLCPDVARVFQELANSTFRHVCYGKTETNDQGDPLR